LNRFPIKGFSTSCIDHSRSWQWQIRNSSNRFSSWRKRCFRSSTGSWGAKSLIIRLNNGPCRIHRSSMSILNRCLQIGLILLTEFG
jgi:hypothetical protein